MKSRKLGLADIFVSEIGIGTNQFGDRVAAWKVARIFDRALELGVTFVDTAESYSDGAAERLIGDAIKSRRHNLVLATKTGSKHTEPPGRLARTQILKKIDLSLRRLRTDYVDVYYLHYPDPGTPIAESLGALNELVTSGKVRYPALSNFTAPAIDVARAICRERGFAEPVVVQNEYNLLVRDPEPDLIATCHASGLALVPYNPLAQGFLTGKYKVGTPVASSDRGYRNEYFKRTWLRDDYFEKVDMFSKVAEEAMHSTAELAIAWLLGEPAVCSVIAGVTEPEQLSRNVRAADWHLTPAERARL